MKLNDKVLIIYNNELMWSRIKKIQTIETETGIYKKYFFHIFNGEYYEDISKEENEVYLTQEDIPCFDEEEEKNET